MPLGMDVHSPRGRCAGGSEPAKSASLSSVQRLKPGAAAPV